MSRIVSAQNHALTVPTICVIILLPDIFGPTVIGSLLLSIIALLFSARKCCCGEEADGCGTSRSFCHSRDSGGNLGARRDREHAQADSAEHRRHDLHGLLERLRVAAPRRAACPGQLLAQYPRDRARSERANR